AERMLGLLRAPYAIGAQKVYASASIGIAIYPPDAVDAGMLFRNADVAMYRAKESGRNGYQFFTPEMNARAARKLMLESNLRRALENGEFELYYQPKADVIGDRATGIEALLRWRRSPTELVPPAEFISALEDSGLIADVGDWVIR